jgi:hypothetical protein
VFRSFLIWWGIASYIISLCYSLKRRSAIRYRRALLYALIYPSAILIACLFAFKIGEIRWRYGDFLLPFSLSYTGYVGLLLLWLYLYDGSLFLLSPYAHHWDILLHFLRRGDKQSLLEMRIGEEVDIKFG